MSREINLAAQDRFRHAINTGEFGVFDEIVAPNSIDHDPAPGQVDGPDGFRSLFGGLRSAFPDLNVSVEHMVADDDNVTFAYTVSGTHRGEFMGSAPTGKHFAVRGVQIGRFSDGKLVERWGSTDQLGILQQLGIHASA